MSPEIEKELFERWPAFFIHKDDPFQSSMKWGFACRDGWRQIIFDLLRELERLTANVVFDEPFEVTQVKQKFGQLTIHSSSSRPEIMAALDAAERKSRRVCEICSKPGGLIIGSGWASRCAQCAGDIAVSGSYDEMGAPQVGAVWLIRSRLQIYGMPLDPVQPWGDDYRNYPLRHAEVWPGRQPLRVAPIRADWATYPRGRVIFDTAIGRFRIHADLCILKNPDFIAAIKSALNVPRAAEATHDDRYRCAACIANLGDRGK